MLTSVHLFGSSGGDESDESGDIGIFVSRVYVKAVHTCYTERDHALLL